MQFQANERSTFHGWLKVSTLARGQPILVPVKLAPYHQRALAGKERNTSTTLARYKGVWWLTLTYTEAVKSETPKDTPVIGVDVGISNFLTTSTGKQYGTFTGKLAERHKRDQAKRRRKRKLRRCLQKQGVKRLPSTANQKLGRAVRQEMNRAINQLLSEHPTAQFAYERLNRASLQFKAKRMNAYLYASNLGHLPKQLAWTTGKLGRRASRVLSAYSSQECSVCHYTARQNRPTQQTFCCGVCGHTSHADVNAAVNLASRLGDKELLACQGRKDIKALLERRHEAWRELQRLAVVQPPA